MNLYSPRYLRTLTRGGSQEILPEAGEAKEQSVPECSAEGEPPAHGPRKAKIILAVSAIAVILLAVTLNWYNSPLQKFDRAMDAKNYTLAGNLYYSLPAKEGDKAYSRVMEAAEDIYDRYNRDEVTYEDSEAFLTELYSAFQLSDIPMVLSNLSALYESKGQFENARELESSGDIYNAIVDYRAVDEEDSQYQDAQAKVEELQEKYKKELIEKAKALSDKKDYDGAAYLLREGLGILDGDDDISGLISEYDDKAEEQDVTKSIAEAEKKAKDGDYPGAIAALQALDATYRANSDVTAKLSDYKGKYSEKSLADAQALAEEGKYEEAVATLNQATNILGETDELMGKVAEYKDRYPVSLLDLEPSSTHGTIEEFDYRTDLYGNEYTQGLVAVGYKEDDTEYVSNGKYKYFSATVGIDKNSAEGVSAVLKVYVDDVLVYTHPAMNRKSDPVDVHVDISMGKFVKLVVSRTDGKLDFLITNPTFHN